MCHGENILRNSFALNEVESLTVLLSNGSGY